MRYFIIFATALLLLTSCIDLSSEKTSHDEPQILEDIAYDVDASHGYTVYIKENEEYVPYLVLTNDYGGNCLLLRKYVLSESKRYNTVYNDDPEYIAAYYEDSEVDVFLNTEYLTSIVSYDSLLIESNVEIAAKNNFPICGSETTYIKRKIFLLSLCEVTGHQSEGIREGERLEYFQDKYRAIATTVDGMPTTWWVRTPSTRGTTLVHSIGKKGQVIIGGIMTIAGETVGGIRPAFCLRRDSLLKRISINGSMYYTIE